MNLHQVGGKAFNLYRLTELGINVPAFKVVEAELFNKWNGSLFDKLENIENHFDNLLTNKSLELELLQYIPGEFDFFAVRSSGTEEDGESCSFAGQFESFLFVKRDQIPKMVIECWKSRFSQRAFDYINARKVNSRFPLAVIVQAMVPAQKSGVLLTAAPDRVEPFHTIISATFGVGEGLVSGICEADSYRVSQESLQIIDRNITTKNVMLTQGKYEGLEEKPVEDNLKSSSVLSDIELKKLTDLSIKIEKSYLSTPQDVEWCIFNDEIFILQTRPLTSWVGLRKTSDLELWDSSNIGESYHGPVSPLTFSFSRHNYKGLFSALLQDVGCTEQSLKKHQNELENLLGHFQGHLYYRLSNWRKLVEPLPGGKIFMNLLGTFIGSEAETGQSAKKQTMEIFDAIKVVCKIIKRYTFRKKYTEEFEYKYSQYTQRQWSKLNENLSESELVEAIDTFYDDLFKFWHMPTYNDFFSVIWVGLFEKSANFCFHSRSPLERNEIKLGLIGAGKGLGPIVELKKLSLLIKNSPELYHLLKRNSHEHLKEMWLKHDSRLNPIRSSIEDFLNLWGFRCEDELMLEATDLKEDPAIFFEQIKLQLDLDEVSTPLKQRKIKLNSLREWCFFPILKLIATRTKEHLETRESMRIKRSELFALMRRLVKRLGHIWFEDKSDIFYLHLEELQKFSKHDRHNIINSRKSESHKSPPERFYQNQFGATIIPKPKTKSDVDGIRGTPCSGGIVQGEIAIYEKGMDISQMSGKILLTERSGPGHVSYFPHLKAMIIEKGSTLSHAVIAAREFGLPTIVGVDDLSLRLAEAKRIEVNADSGQITILS